MEKTPIACPYCREMVILAKHRPFHDTCYRKFKKESKRKASFRK